MSDRTIEQDLAVSTLLELMRDETNDERARVQAAGDVCGDVCGHYTSDERHEATTVLLNLMSDSTDTETRYWAATRVLHAPCPSDHARHQELLEALRATR